VFLPNGQLDAKNFEIKVRPRFVNNTQSPIGISIVNPSAVRLLVSGDQIGNRWSPPPLTKADGDRPFLVSCNGGTFWAIPPNVAHDAHLTAGQDYSGFSTEWDASTLPPNGVYFKPLRYNPDGSVIREGDVVFQVPLDTNGEARIYGLAVLNIPDHSILGVALFGNNSQWGPARDPNSF
jgi:hypothetical protein